MEHDRRACRDFMHLVLSQLALDEVPLLWHYLAYHDDRLLACFDDTIRPCVCGLINAWCCLMPTERQDVLMHFVTVMEEVARHAAAALPRKEDG
jgi:hypothetical protein